MALSPRKIEVRQLLALIGLIFLCAAGVFGVGRCKQRSSERAPAPRAPHEAEPADRTSLPEDWAPAIGSYFKGGPAAGTMDVSNEYASTIMLTEDGERVHASCSGILLSPRVALTAASCVCPPRQAGTSSCAERAFIMTVRFGAVKDPEFKEESTAQTLRRFEGKVRVHPAFKLKLDDQGAVLSTHADLAIIILDSPVGDELPRIPFAETEVQENEVLVMTGYGDDPRFRGVPGIRYFRHNRVTQFHEAAEGRVMYEQQGSFVYNGYTGGPCFREDKNHRWLTGIASAGSDRELSFTSVYFFRNWLLAELQHAATGDFTSTPAPQHLP